MDNVQKKLDELVKQADYMIASPDTIESMKKKGLPIKSTFITYKEYLDKLFTNKRKISEELINKLPHLDDSIANSTVQSLYDELRECFVLGIPGAAITLALILLELALKYRLFEERKKSDPNSSWEEIEKLDFASTVSDLGKKGIITTDEKKRLDEYNIKIRNPYIHYNIYKLIKDSVLKELSSVDINTGEVTIHKNVRPADKPFLWFSAKKVRDRKEIIPLTNFCINWVNKVLKK